MAVKTRSASRKARRVSKKKVAKRRRVSKRKHIIRKARKPKEYQKLLKLVLSGRFGTVQRIYTAGGLTKSDLCSNRKRIIRACCFGVLFTKEIPFL